MSKVNLQPINFSGKKITNDNTNEADILAGLFTIPSVEAKDNCIKEFVLPSKFFESTDFRDIEKNLILNNNVSSKSEDKKIIPEKLSILSPKFFSLEMKKKSNKNFNLSMNLNLSPTFLDKIDKVKKPIDMIYDEIEKKINTSNNYFQTQEKKSKRILENSTKFFSHEINSKKKHSQLSYISETLDEIDEHLIKMSSEGKINQNVGMNKLVNKVKFNSDIGINPVSGIKSSLNIDSLNQNYSTNNFNSDKNLNLILNNYTDQLDLSQEGWTEKLVSRLEKGILNEDQEIELFLKPKELGKLKINLKVNNKNAKIIFKVENNFALQSLQQNELMLVKLLADNGINAEKTSFENSGFFKDHQNPDQSFQRNKENKDLNNPKDNPSNSQEFIERKNSSYIVNINA